MELSNVKVSTCRRKPRKRVGRGHGAGTGKTCGRGMRGVGARSGPGLPAWFEGGQMPLYRRLPKRGFNNKRFQKNRNRKGAPDSGPAPEEAAD